MGVHGGEEEDGDEGREGSKEGGLRGRGSVLGYEVSTEDEQRTRILSQMPWVSLARVLAEQGATSTMSAHRRSCSTAGRDQPQLVRRLTLRAHLDMQNWVANLGPALRSRPTKAESAGEAEGCSAGRTHLPLLCIGPDFYSTSMLLLQSSPVVEVQ